MRGPSTERRSFLAEHAGDLWVGDAMHPRAPVIAPDGKLRKVILFSQIDNATRFVVHSYLAVVDGEDAAAQEYGLKQAILKGCGSFMSPVDGSGSDHLHELEARPASRRWQRVRNLTVGVA